MNFSFLEFLGSACKVFGRKKGGGGGVGKYINFRATSKYFMQGSSFLA